MIMGTVVGISASPASAGAHAEVQDQQQREDHAEAHLGHAGETLAERGAEVVAVAPEQRRLISGLADTALADTKATAAAALTARGTISTRRAPALGLGLRQPEGEADEQGGRAARRPGGRRGPAPCGARRGAPTAGWRRRRPSRAAR